MARKRKRGLGARVLRKALQVVLGLGGALVLAVLLLRFIPPFATAFMIQSSAAALWEGRPYDARYQWVRWEAISPYAGLAVIAAEDQRFLEHSGFDMESIQDALAESERGGRLRGASTITQQVAKNLFLWPGRSFLRKGLEAGLTVLIEALWPKRRILEIYLNVAELGDGVFGVEAASRRYFRKSASALRPEEAAVLAAVLPNPRRLRADRPSSYVLERRGWILKQMAQLGGPEYLKQLE